MWIDGWMGIAEVLDGLTRMEARERRTFLPRRRVARAPIGRAEAERQRGRAQRRMGLGLAAAANLWAALCRREASGREALP